MQISICSLGTVENVDAKKLNCIVSVEKEDIKKSS